MAGPFERDPLATRGPLTMAELIAQGLVALSEVRIADASAVLTLEQELLSAFGEGGERAADPAALERMLGYPVEAGAGDLHDYVERKLVSEYLIAVGVDAVVLPLRKRSFAYSHVARNGSLVAIASEIAPEALIHRLTSCPRVLQYGLDGDGLELHGALFRRTAAVSAPGWPERSRWLADGAGVEDPADLRALVRAVERGEPLPVPTVPDQAPAAPAAPTAPKRRRPRHTPLTRDE